MISSRKASGGQEKKTSNIELAIGEKILKNVDTFIYEGDNFQALLKSFISCEGNIPSVLLCFIV